MYCVKNALRPLVFAHCTECQNKFLAGEKLHGIKIISGSDSDNKNLSKSKRHDELVPGLVYNTGIFF